MYSLFYWIIYYTSWSIGLQLKKNKAIKCKKKLMFKKWIYIQINAKKETR